MDPALRASASGMLAQQIRTEVIANNLANVNTTGFKRSRAHFEDLLYQTIQGQAVIGSEDTNIAPSVQVGRGVRLAAVQRQHEQGIIEMGNRKRFGLIRYFDVKEIKEDPILEILHEAIIVDDGLKLLKRKKDIRL